MSRGPACAWLAAAGWGPGRAAQQRRMLSGPCGLPFRLCSRPAQLPLLLLCTAPYRRADYTDIKAECSPQAPLEQRCE